MTARDRHLDIVRKAWDAYHADYMGFNLKEWPDFHRHFAAGGTMLDDHVVEMLGDVEGLKLLDICCACDAKQAFSWANLGAHVTACDLSPVAVRIAQQNAERIGLNLAFHVADAQTLDPIRDGSFDVVVATFLCWFEDILLACRNWHRVLKPHGRLLIHTGHPVANCLQEADGALGVTRDYHRSGPYYGRFTGTPLADRHGGWGASVPCVEFHHTVADIINAVIGAGLALERVVEPDGGRAEGAPAQLPSKIALLARKPIRSADDERPADSATKGDASR